jgi:hypothetical protein
MAAITYFTAANYTPSFTQENLDTLNAAIVTGATQVQYGDKMVTYRSLNDLMRLRGLIVAELSGGSTVSFGRRTVGVFHSTKTIH